MSEDVLARIRELVQPSLAQVGVELFDVELAGSGRAQVLRLLIDRQDGGVTLDDCERASGAVTAVLDAYDPIETAYHLEVSSPGAERRLRDLDDWRRHVGQLVNVRFSEDGEDAGETIVEGRLLAVADDAVEVMVRQRRREVAARIPVASIRAGRLAIDF